MVKQIQSGAFVRRGTLQLWSDVLATAIARDWLDALKCDYPVGMRPFRALHVLRHGRDIGLSGVVTPVETFPLLYIQP